MFAPLIALALIVPSFQQPPDAQIAAWISGDLQRGADVAPAPAGERLSAVGLGDDLAIARQVGGRLNGAGAQGVVVGVHGGEVVLDGEVPDSSRRDKLIALAAGVDGVRGVSAHLLLPGETAAAEPAASPPAASAAPARSEPFDFLTPDDLAGRNVVVSVDDGVATLTGIASSDEARRFATVTAQRVPGVRAVRNELVARVSNRADDHRLALLVARQLENDVLVQTVSNALMVSVDHGVARLTGRVRDEGQRAQATRVAASLPAVFAVDNRLVVDENLVLPMNGRIPGFRQFHDH